MKKLERSEMKNLKGGLFASDDLGGGGCTMTFQAPNGAWITEIGSCDTSRLYANGFQIGVRNFCHTSSFSSPASLGSNGGVSRCGADVIWA